MRVTRAGLTARALLTLGALLPYWRLLTFGIVFVTDDYFASDIFDGELPVRALIGQIIRHGHLPLWTDRLCSGLPLVGVASDPIGIAAFTLLPPAPALDLLVIVLLLVAAHGAYSLARRFGSDRIGAVLAGVAFAGSGYIACQLKHLGIVSTIAWLPLGLLLLDRAMEERRHTETALFGLVFANQALSGFPQSAYVCGLVYASLALFRGVSRTSGRWTFQWPALIRAAVAMALGGAAGALVLLPLSSLGAISDRVDTAGWDWATRLAYWPPNALSFLIPYAHGDISNNTYSGPPFFWEDYGYVGIATFLLAVYGGIRERRRPVVAFSIAMTVVAYLFVLGRATPAYRVAYLVIPGMSLFRFPTRFLIVVELGLALLGAIGLTRLRDDLQRAWKTPARTAAFVCAALCAGTAIDLFVHQPRQNPMVSARDWLAAPATAAIVSNGAPDARTFTPRHRDVHRAAFQAAHGWADVSPYFAERDLLEPNTGGGLWDVPSGDCYAGVSARWYTDVWGDHNRELSLFTLLSSYDPRSADVGINPHMPSLLASYGVTHLLSRNPLQSVNLTLAGRTANAVVYRIGGAARVRFVSSAVPVATDADAAKRLLDPAFDPSREVLLLDLPEGTRLPSRANSAMSDGGPAPMITRDDPDVMTIDAAAPRDGFIVLADTFYPGWSADVDGQSAPIYRANLSIRAIPIAAGRHRIVVRYDPPGWHTGVAITALAIASLLAWLAFGVYAAGRGRRAPASAHAPHTA
jgi:hypothetical protein